MRFYMYSIFSIERKMVLSKIYLTLNFQATINCIHLIFCVACFLKYIITIHYNISINLSGANNNKKKYKAFNE